MNKVFVKNVRLSGNPDTQVVDVKGGINGKLNKMKDGRLFFEVELEDDDLFRKTRRQVTYSTDDKGNWQGGSPEEFIKAIGKEVAGAYSVTEAVIPYVIGERTVGT